MVDEYRELKRVNISNLKLMKKSPLAYKWNLDHPQENKPALAFGRAVHCAVFEPAKFDEHYAQWTGGRRYGKEWDKFLEQNQGKESLTADEFERVRTIRDIVRNHELVAPYLVAGEAEARILWEDPITKIACKGRADWISHSQASILDLKTTRDIKRFQNDCAKFGYHDQAAFYIDGCMCDPTRKAEYGFVLVAIESEPPHDLGVFLVVDDALEAGRKEYIRLLELVKLCEQSGKWPGAYEFTQNLVLPKWASGQEDDELSLIMDGEEITL